MVLNELRKNLVALLELQDYDFLQVCKLGTQLRQKPKSAPNKEEELKVLPVETAFLRSTRPVFLALGLVQDRDRRTSGSQDARCQTVRNGRRVPGGVITAGDDGRGLGAQVLPGVIGGSSGGWVYPGVDAGLEGPG